MRARAIGARLSRERRQSSRRPPAPQHGYVNEVHPGGRRSGWAPAAAIEIRDWFATARKLKAWMPQSSIGWSITNRGCSVYLARARTSGEANDTRAAEALARFGYGIKQTLGLLPPLWVVSTISCLAGVYRRKVSGNSGAHLRGPRFPWHCPRYGAQPCRRIPHIDSNVAGHGLSYSHRRGGGDYRCHCHPIAPEGLLVMTIPLSQDQLGGMTQCRFLMYSKILIWLMV